MTTESTAKRDAATDATSDALPPVAARAKSRRGEDVLDQQRAIVAMGRRAIAAPDLHVLMQDAAALLAEVLGAEFSLVAELLPDGHSPRLALSLRRTGSNETEPPIRRSVAAESGSLGGYALQVAHPVLVADLGRDARLADPFLGDHGIRSALAVPLKLQDRSFGSLCVCSTQQRDFDDADLLFAETVAHLVSTAIGRARAEKSLADERRLAAGVLQTVDALVLVLDDQGQIVSVNPACERITGYVLEEIRGRSVWSVFSAAGEADACRRRLGQLREGKTPETFENQLRTKQGEARQVAWSCSAIAAADGNLEWIIATGIDVTEQRRAQEEAERAVRAAEEARQTMADALLTAGKDDEATQRAVPGNPTAADADSPAGDSGQSPPDRFANRRGHPRRPFPYRQRVAAVIDGKLPDHSAFADVQCRDIAASGFSFFSPTPPMSDTLVVALGAAPRFAFLVAQVVHVTRVGKQGEHRYLVGCSYVGRAAY